MNLFEVVVRILISQLLRGSTSRADNAKACFWWQIFKSHVFGGHFLLFLGILGVLMLNFAFFTPKRHFLIRKDIFRCISWNFLTSGVGCTLVQEPKKVKKMPSRLYMLGICRQVTPYANVMKLGTVGLVGYVIALTTVGPGPSGLLHCYCGNAWYIGLFVRDSENFVQKLNWKEQNSFYFHLFWSFKFHSVYMYCMATQHFEGEAGNIISICW